MIAAVLLAAGESSRMGRPKLNLPWRGADSIIEHVVHVFSRAGAAPIIVVTGSDSDEIASCLREMDVTLTHNPHFAGGEMLSSVQAGIRKLEGLSANAALICPGDLPLLKVTTVEQLIQAWQKDPCPILIPSHAGRRGHPLLVAREMWADILAMKAGTSLRDFLRDREQQAHYLPVDDEGIRRDIDTPQDYHDAQTKQPRAD